MYLFIFWITHGQSPMSFQFGLSPPGDKSNLHMTQDACLRKHPDAGKDWGQEERGLEKGTTEDEIVGWHHRLNEHEFEQAPWDGERQGSLVYCSPWGGKESDKTTEWLNNKMHTCFCASCGSTWIRTFPRWKSVRSSSSTDLTCQSTMVTWIDHHTGHGHSCSIQNLAPK